MTTAQTTHTHPTRSRRMLGAATLAAALLVLGGTQAMAQSAPPPPPAAEQPAPMAGQQHGPRGMHMSPEQRQQRMAQHQAKLKQKLQLTAEQEGAWKTFTDAMQPQPHARLDRADWSQMSTPERIDRMRALRSQRAAAMDKRDDAVKAFYAALTPTQQKTFDAESVRMHGPKGHGKGMQHQHHTPQ